MTRNFTTRSALVFDKGREREKASSGLRLFSSGRKETTECAIIRAQHPRRRHRRRLRRRRRRCRYCRPARYDNFTFIDRSGRTTLYLPLYPLPSFPFASLFHSLPRDRSFFSFPRSRAERSLSLSLFTVLVQGRDTGAGGCAPRRNLSGRVP